MADLKRMYSTVLKDDFPENMTIILGDEKLVYAKREWLVGGERKGLRYGENPDQPAALYELVDGELSIGGIKWRPAKTGLVSALKDSQMLQAGKHPGKINLTDVDNGANILQHLHAKPACVILKHNNPCGAAWTDEGLEYAIGRAYIGDRIAAFGGVVVANRPIDAACARIVSDSYFEVIAAPAYEEGALELLKQRKNLRILEIPGLGRLEEFLGHAFLDIKSLADGGIIVQRSYLNIINDESDFLPAAAKMDGVEVTARAPDTAELADLRFAWAVEAGVTSNSVIFARDGATVAIGTGEQDRVGCIEIAVSKAYVKYADLLSWRELGLSIYELRKKAEADPALAERLTDIDNRTKQAKGGLAGSRMVSDGFFPFRDGVDAAIAQGVTAIAQPGGSIRDAESIIACNEAIPQVAMVFTGQRSFRH